MKHQIELGLDARKRCGGSLEDRSDSFLFPAPSLQFLLIGFIEPERSRLRIPARPSVGKLDMQGGAHFRGTITSCYGLVDFRVGLSANASTVVR